MYALDGLPDVAGLPDPKAALASMVSLTPTTEALERSYDAAKYGRVSEHPHVEFTIPSLRWPRLAPEGKHVLVARAQYAPYRLRDGATWDAARSSALADCVTSDHLPRHAEARESRRCAIGAHAGRSRANVRVDRGRAYAGRDHARPDPVHASRAPAGAVTRCRSTACISAARVRIPGPAFSVRPGGWLRGPKWHARAKISDSVA